MGNGYTRGTSFFKYIMEEWAAKDISFVLEMTNTVLWNVDLETGAAARRGPVDAVFNVEESYLVDSGEFFETVVHPDDAARVRQQYLSVLQGESGVFRTEFRTHPENGDIQWVESYARTHQREETELLSGLSTDITARKQRELELERQNERLAEVASVLSHDLRNPLTVAKGHLALAAEECDSDHLEAIEHAHDRIDTLIESLLADARREEPTMRGGQSLETSVVDVGGLAEQCWENVATVEATLIVKTTGAIEAERAQFARLLENLFRNAIDHAGPEVTITVGDLDDDSGFYVADDGPGVPDDVRERVFEKGYSTSGEGAGLGLHIVKTIVDAHDWTISVTDSATGGARFEITGVEP